MHPRPTAETSSPWPRVRRSIGLRLPTPRFGHSRCVFDHVTIRVSDREASQRFYDTVLAVLGIEKTHAEDELPEWDDWSLTAASEGKPVTRRLHVGFPA